MAETITAPKPSPAPAAAIAPLKPEAGGTKPSPEPKAAPAPKEASEETHVDDPSTNPFDILDAKLNPKPKADPKPSEKADAKQEGEAEGEEESAKAEPDSKPKADKPERTFQTSKGLREHAEKTAKELKDAREKLTAHEAKIAEFEGRSKETTTLAEQLAAVQKERDEARAEARGLKEEMSPDFVERYQKPFNDSADEAKRFIEQVPVQNEDGTTRKASWERDFASIYALPEVEAAERAEVMFGKHAGRVMARYDELHRLSNIAYKAKEAEKANWKATETQRAAQAVQQREATNAAVSQAEKALSTKFAQWYGDDPSDPDGNALVKDMSAKMDQAPKTLSEHAAKQARIKLNTVNFPRVVHKLNKANERIAELEAKLAAKGEGEPGKTKRTAGAEPKGDTGTWDSELAALKNAK